MAMLWRTLEIAKIDGNANVARVVDIAEVGEIVKIVKSGLVTILKTLNK